MSTTTYTPDNLFAGDFPTETKSITIESGQNLSRGAVLGKITSSGEYKQSVSTASDGSETPRGVLAQDTDASSAATAATMYVAGTFRESELDFGSGVTAADLEQNAIAIIVK